MHAHLAQEVNVIQVEQPIAVVRHNRFPLGKVDQAGHLLLETGDVVVDGLLGEHLAHVGLSGRVADHARAAAEQGDRHMPGLLHPGHHHDLDKVTHMQTVRCRVKADVESDLVVVQQIPDLFLAGRLRD